jgi:hypothetical protein
MSTPAPSTGPVHTLQLTQEDVASFSNIGNGSISFGPLTLSWNFSLSPLQVTVTASLVGITIGTITLDPSHPTLTIGGSAGGFTAEVDLTLNVSVPSFSYHVIVKAPIIGTIVDKSGTINL